MVSEATLDRYRMYEAAVQDPEQQISLFLQAHSENFQHAPQILREDFSGTSWISSEWVKGDAARAAFALDIDEEALAVGEELHVKALDPEVRKRIHLRKQDVMVPTEEKADIIAACNFSYFIFHDRADLMTYFKAAHASLKSDGAFVLETAGGPGFEETPMSEKRVVTKDVVGENGAKPKPKKWFRYTWQQRSFDPMHRRGEYAIHFDLGKGKKVKNAFVYDWRVWTIPEVADALRESGFDDVQVYWEVDEDEHDFDHAIYERQTVADNEYDTWIVYIVGLRKSQK